MVLRTITLVLSVLMNVSEARPDTGGQGRHLTVQSTVGDILRHPSFAGFARLILPWDDRAYDENLPLTRIGSLLPYHTHVHPDTVTTALNRMIDDAAGGKTVLYRFYSDAQMQDDPAKRNTGLFFLRGRPGAPFAVIVPGGGFSYVGSVHEGFPYAEEVRSKGYNAFVLKYRVRSIDIVTAPSRGVGRLSAKLSGGECACPLG